MSLVSEHITDGTPRDVVERYESLPELAEKSDFGALDHNVVVIDTETTGLSFNHDELIQIAAAKMENGEVSDWFVTFVNPGHPIPEDIVHLTGIGEDDVKDASSPQEALASLVDFAGDAIMVAHNTGFDKTFVTRHPQGYPLLDNIWVDTLDLSRIALPRLKSHRLIDLVHTFGTPVSTHRADDDVAATCVVYRILLAAVMSMPPELVGYIANMSTLEEWSTAFVFQELSNTREERRFSLRSMRESRVLDLPTRPARKDADDIVATLVHPSADEIREEFSSQGVLGHMYEDYETREEQSQMAFSIRDAFEAGENLVVEAGTGVGKSMAYLVPAALLARKNGIAVGIATKTNSLLDQLVYKELPALSQALEEKRESGSAGLTWAPLKGMSHYACLRKVNNLVEEGPTMREVAGSQVSQAPALASLLSYIEQSGYDDFDSLKIDYRVLPRRSFTSTSMECLRRKCPFYKKLCFAHGARSRAELADIMVTNHTLLFCDVAADGGLLPTARHWVIDEAHSIEGEARSAFAQTLDSEELSRIASRVSASSASRNVFTRAERALSGGDVEQLTLFFGLLAKGKSAGESFAKAVDDYLVHVKDLLYFDQVKSRSSRRKNQVYDHVDIWINGDVRGTRVFNDVASCALDFVEKCDQLIKALQEIVGYLEGVDAAAVSQRELAVLAYDLKGARNAAELIFQTASESYVYQATVHRKKDRFVDKVKASLLDVGEKMNETFYTQTQSVIFTSATLAVGERFDSFEAAVGLNASEFSQSRELKLSSSYDYDNNMIVYVVKDMPEPNDPAYADALADLLKRMHIAQQGSMLTLFTNRREMEKAYEAVNPQLKEHDLRLVCQKYGVSVKGLRDEFLADEHLSLFALKSFWEGFDAPGSTLRGVVIPKLPFARPTDPLYCERATRDDRAWWHYVLPQAVIETKQAAGRLIRKADDRGVLVLADKRLVTKSYGKVFLGSLQSKTVRVRTSDEVVQALALMADMGLAGAGKSSGRGDSATERGVGV